MRRVRTRLAGALLAVLALTTATACGGGATAMTKGLESVGGIDGLVKIPGVAQTPAGQLYMEDGAA